MIPYGRQDINAADIEAVVAVLQSDWLTQGPVIPEFETAVAKYCGASHGVALCNATAALHLSCLALELGPGDILWTTPNTYVASANCALYCGAQVDFVDIDERSYNMSVAALAAKLAAAETTGTLPKVVVVVHFAGQSCEMKAIYSLAQKYQFSLIEDASHAIGGQYLGENIGCGHYSDITVFSFHPVKVMTTGEGGMALTNNETLAAKLELLRSHGITRDPKELQGSETGGWYYEQLELGFNYRMTAIQAALGCSQLKRLDRFVQKRSSLAESYNKSLSALPLVLPWQHTDTASAYHLYPVQLNPKAVGKDRPQVFTELREAGIGVNVHYIPVHTQPYYQRLGFKTGDFPVAEEYYRNALSLPLFSSLSQEQYETVISALAEVLA